MVFPLLWCVSRHDGMMVHRQGLGFRTLDDVLDAVSEVQLVYFRDRFQSGQRAADWAAGHQKRPAFVSSLKDWKNNGADISEQIASIFEVDHLFVTTANSSIAITKSGAHLWWFKSKKLYYNKCWWATVPLMYSHRWKNERSRSTSFALAIVSKCLCQFKRKQTIDWR